MKNKYDSGWGVIFRNESKWDYKGEKYEIWKLLSWQLSKCMINYMIDKK